MVCCGQIWTQESEGDLTYLRLGTNGNELSSCCFSIYVPPAVSSVLSWFIFNILSHIHWVSSSIQSFKLWTRAGKSEGVLELWGWESSAKKWYEWPDWQMTVLRDCVYKVNKKVPELNLVAHHISKWMELMRDQQKQTECKNLGRRWTSPEPFQNSQRWYVTFWLGCRLWCQKLQTDQAVTK